MKFYLCPVDHTGLEMQVVERPGSSIGDLLVEGPGQVRDFDCLRKTSHEADIGLGDVHRFFYDQLAMLPEVAELLACGDGDHRLPAQIPEQPEVVPVDGLLKEGDVVGLDQFAELDRLGQAKEVVGVHHQFDVVADGLPYGPDPGSVLPHVRSVIDPYDHFEPRVPLRHHYLGDLYHFVAVVFRQTEGDVSLGLLLSAAQET